MLLFVTVASTAGLLGTPRSPCGADDTGGRRGEGVCPVDTAEQSWTRIQVPTPKTTGVRCGAAGASPWGRDPFFASFHVAPPVPRFSWRKGGLGSESLSEWLMALRSIRAQNAVLATRAAPEAHRLLWAGAVLRWASGPEPRGPGAA